MAVWTLQRRANAAVMRQRTVISKQRVSLGKRTFKPPTQVLKIVKLGLIVSNFIVCFEIVIEII